MDQKEVQKVLDDVKIGAGKQGIQKTHQSRTMPNLNVRTGRCVRYALPYRNSANAILMLSTYRKAKHELVSLGVRNSSSL